MEELSAFTEEYIRPYAGVFEQKEALPKPLIAQLAERGYLAAPFPKEYGGMGLSDMAYGRFTEEIGKACCAVRTLITVHTSLVGGTLLKWGSEAQKAHWLPAMAKGEKLAAFALSEPNVGSDAANIQTAYRKEGNKFILNGEKKWISFGDIADLFIVVAQGEAGTSAFIVERGMPGLETTPISGLMASKAAHTALIQLKEVTVPEENLISKEGNGFAYIVNTALDNGRFSVAWAGVAIAQAAVEEMVTYSRNRKQFGQELYKHQMIRGIIGDAVTEVHAARALCEKAARMREEKHEDHVMATNIAKLFSSRAAVKITGDAVQLLGANGCSDAYPIERLFREAKVLEIIEGTTQIQQDLIAKYGLKKYYRRR